MSGRMIEPDRTVRAEFDYENARIRLPIAAFTLSHEDQHVISIANFLAHDNCMQRLGFRYPSPGEFVHVEDRTYGLWNVARATLHGFALAGAQQLEAANADYRTATDVPGWEQAFARCAGEVEAVRATFVPEANPGHQAVAVRVGTEAYGYARADPAWDVAREAWEAGYQAVLIRENEAALAAEQVADARCLGAARAYIATHR